MKTRTWERRGFFVKKCRAVFTFAFGCGTLIKNALAEILEIIMVVSFGASWPLNVIKSYKARSTKGKSLGFLLLIFFGYIAGIASKLVNEVYMAQIGQKWYVLFFYVLNFIMVGTDLLLYIRNRRLDKEREVEEG